MQDFAVVRFESSALGDATVQVRSLHGTERISQLFEFELHIVVAGNAGLDPKALMANMASIVILRTTTEDGQSREERRIFGIVSHVTDRLTLHGSHTEYLLTFVPRAWRSTLTCLNDIFMDMTVPEIIEKKLKDNCTLEPNKDFEFRLRATYPVREFVVQYQETDLAFMSRLAEDQGICFFFEHRDGRDVMVFSDDNSGFRPADPDSVPIASRGAELSVYDLVSDHQQITTTHRTRDYNYRNPGVDVLGEAKAAAGGGGVIEEYGIHAKTPGEATQLARVRAEEEACRHQVFRGKGEVSGFRAGSVVKLEGHPRGELELVLTEVHHHSTQAVLGSGGTGDENDYQNEFRAIPKAATYRPARITPKPVVPGVVTGLVQSPADKEMGAVDDQGLYRVALMYDSVTSRDEGKASRPLRMAQPSAGADRSFHLPLKAGVEVLVTCVNGDPDRPIIAGAVPNPRTASPVTAGNAEKSGMRTNKNEWFFDDRDPRFKLCVDGGMHVFQVGAPNEPEKGVILTTTENYTAAAQGTITSWCDTSTAFQDVKTALTAQNVSELAGSLKPWKVAEGIGKMAEGLAGMVKGLADGVESFQKQKMEVLKQAQKQADANLANRRKELAAKDGQTYDPNNPPPKENDDGTTRPMTEDEFYADAAKKRAASNPKDAQSLQSAANNAQRTGKQVTDAEKAWDEGGGKIVAQTKAVADIAAAGVKGVSAAAGALYSAISKKSASAAEKLLLAAAVEEQASAITTSTNSKPRSASPTPVFRESFNIQAATQSAGLFGMENALVVGKKWASVFSSGQSTIVGGGGAHLFSPKLVQLAAGQRIVATADSLVDVLARKASRFVAHAEDQKIPGGHNMLFVAEKSMKLLSEQELHATGHKKLAVVSGTGDGAGMVADPKGVYIGLIASGAADSKSAPKKENAMFVTNNEVTTKAADSVWSIKKSITGDAKNAFMIKAGKSVQLEAGGAFEGKSGKAMTLKASKDVTVKPGGNFVAKGKKVMLG